MTADVKNKAFAAECPMCSMIINGFIYREPAKTYEQVTLDFDQIPLTDSQRGTKKRIVPKPK